MHRFRFVVAASFLLFPLSLVHADSENCPNGDWCACPGMSQCLSPYATCEEACGGGRASSGYSAPAYDPQAARLAQEAAMRQNIINTNNAGVAFYKQGDWANAISYFELAVRSDPDNAIYKQNLANAKANQKYAKDVAEAQAANTRAANASLDRMQNVMGGLNFDGSAHDAPASPATAGPAGTRAMGNAPAAPGGLGFTASVPATNGATAALATDPMVVDARNVPSGLSASVERSIASAYPKAAPDVVDRLKKGFQAVDTKDWKAAHAWFADALQRDPKNAGLQRFVELTEDPAERKTPAPKPPKKPLPPPDADVAAFFTFFRDPPGHQGYEPTEAVRAHVLNLSKEEFNRLLALQLPEPGDQELLMGPGQ
jgi:tetratricopeptide (TPR) repeat protein